MHYVRKKKMIKFEFYYFITYRTEKIFSSLGLMRHCDVKIDNKPGRLITIFPIVI